MAVSGKTLADVISLIRTLIGEPKGSRTAESSALRRKDSELTSLFNWSQDEVALESKWKIMTSLDTITAATTIYTLPAACAVLRLVEYKDSASTWRPLQEVNIREKTIIEGNYVSSDEPVYQVFGDTLVLTPAFPTTKNNGLRYTYEPRPDKLVSTTSDCVLSPTGAQAAIWRVVEVCRTQDEKLDLAQAARAEYTNSLAQSMSQYSQMRNQRLHSKQDVLFGSHYPYRRGLGRR